MALFTILLLAVVFLLALLALQVAIRIRNAEKHFKAMGVPYMGSGISSIFGLISGSLEIVHLEDSLYQAAISTNQPLVGLSDFSGSRTFAIQDLELIKNIMVKDFDHFVDRRPMPSNKYVKKMLFALDADHWRAVRIKLTPLFSTGKIRRMFQIFKTSGDRFDAYLKEHMNYPVDKSVDMDFTLVFPKYALDVIGTCAYGIDSKSFQVSPDKTSEFEVNAKNFQFSFGGLKLLAFIFAAAAPSLAELFGIDVIDSTATKYFEAIVARVVKHRRETGERREDFLQMLLDLQQGILKADEDDKEGEDTAKIQGKRTNHVTFDDEDLVANGMMFIMGGFDTIQSLLLMTIYNLALDQNVQDKLRQEVNQVLKKHQGQLTYDGINEMTYLDMVINETLRLYPPAVRTERLCTKEYQVPNSNVVMEKNDVIIFLFRGIQRDPRYYSDPDKYIPERFSQEEKQSRHPYAFLPFGHGPRNCIGNRFALFEVKTVIAQMISSFRIQPGANTAIPPKFSNNGVIKPTSMWLNISAVE